MKLEVFSRIKSQGSELLNLEVSDHELCFELFKSRIKSLVSVDLVGVLADIFLGSGTRGPSPIRFIRVALRVTLVRRKTQNESECALSSSVIA